MKKLLFSIASILAIVLLLFGLRMQLDRSDNVNSKNSDGQDKVLNLYNWGDYIDPELLDQFTKETGYKVIYETFDSNEAMYTKIKQGGTNYDLAVPSDYMIEKLRKEHLLIPLDHKRLTGFKNYDKKFLNLSFDPHNKYSLPYFWGTLGIVYNDQLIGKEKITSWDDLWNPNLKKKIMLIDSARDDLGFTLISQGKSVNTKSMKTLEAAKAKLDRLMPNVKAIVADEMKMYMAQSEAAVAVTYSGEAADMLNANKHLHYVVPSQGTNLWFDNLVIPKTAKHLDAAYAFLNFISRPDIAAKNAEYIGYATPNQAAMKYIPKEIKEDPQFYPSAKIINKSQVYTDLGPYWTEKYNDFFLEFKMLNK